jgi:hypothetical protein
VADLYIVDFGSSEDGQARREADRDAESRRLHVACVRYLVVAAAIEEQAVRRVVGALSGWRDSDGRACRAAAIRACPLSWQGSMVLLPSAYHPHRALRISVGSGGRR